MEIAKQCAQEVESLSDKTFCTQLAERHVTEGSHTYERAQGLGERAPGQVRTTGQEAVDTKRTERTNPGCPVPLNPARVSIFESQAQKFVGDVRFLLPSEILWH